MTNDIVIRRNVSINDQEYGSNLSLSLSAARAVGIQVNHFAAHPRSGWPESPTRYRSRVKHERHLAAIERRVEGISNAR